MVMRIRNVNGMKRLLRIFQSQMPSVAEISLSLSGHLYWLD